MAESEEELKSLVMKVKEKSEKAGLKLNIQKMKIMAPGPMIYLQQWFSNLSVDKNHLADFIYYILSRALVEILNHMGLGICSFKQVLPSDTDTGSRTM